MAGMVELSQMLEARDRRAQRQRELLEQYRLPMVSFTLNIAGPVKNSPLIRRGFRLGRELLLGQLARIKAPVLFREETDEDTGLEGLYVVNAAPETLKTVACDTEDRTALGRLLDLDVLTPDGVKLDRSVPRRCLICGKPAKECGRNRSHTVRQLQKKTHDILEDAIETCDAETAASLAVRALLYEVCTTPKPGLVDRSNSGSHRDMDIFTFMSSASALWPYFAQCVRIGRRTAARPASETLAALRWPGKQAEGAMLSATGGVNTHKGAIFSMGLACAALGRMDREAWGRPEAVLAQVASMAAGTVEQELDRLTEGATAGQRFYLLYGVTGIRGEAEAGFPSVLKYGLPVLENGLAQGRSVDEAGAAAMLALLAHTDDTNMLARGGIELSGQKAGQLRTLLAGNPYPDKAALQALDEEYIGANLSPGGSADLLALCYLLHSLKEAA